MKGGRVVKKNVSLVIAIIVITFVTVAHAEVKAGSASITPFVGGYFFESSENLKNSAIVGFRASYSFTENFALEGMVSYLKSTMKDVSGEPSQKIYGCGIDAIYHFMPESRFVPFIALGVGGIHYGYPHAERSSKVTVDYGAGAKIFLTDNVALRFDVRHVMPQNDHYNDILATAGVTFSFGGHPKIKKESETCDKDTQQVTQAKVEETRVKESRVEEPPVPIKPVSDTDEDGDGVSNKLDKCPGTPVNVAVDKDGCPLDTDADGVPDYMDQCPGTPAGVTVDKNGCPADSDRDGVPDYLDKCPGTPASVAVDKNGCPSDTDGDGVPDYLDKCSGTPAGVTVDKDGCLPDTDGDGVPDSLDKCPGTPASAEVDKNGCVVVAEKKVEKQPEAELPQKMLIKMEFDSGKAVISKKYHQEIKKVADFMMANPDATATIVGHTDNIGNHAKNVKLSKARANSVSEYLIKKFGIDPSRIRAFGYGPDKPIAGNKTKEGRQKNRRIVAVFETVK
jgi:OmpA-OmpF porin, OOP family